MVARTAKIAVALMAFSLMANSATAADRLVIKLNGHVSAVGAAIDQTNMDGLDGAALAVDTGLFGSIFTPLEGGGEIGARIAFDLDYATNFDSFLNDAGESNVLEELWAYWDTRIGRFQVGLSDGAADILGVGVPSVTSSIRVDNPEVYLVGFPCELFCSTDPQAPGSLFNPNGMQLRSDLMGSDDYLKAIYVSPNLSGLRIAVSYAPDGTRDTSEIFGDDEFNEQAHIWDFALNYSRIVGNLEFAVSAGYVTGENVNQTAFWLGDLEEWGAAAKVGYREWSLGAAYRKTNVAGGGPIVQGLTSNVLDGVYTSIFSVGLAYNSGPWAVGANYIVSEEELLFTDSKQQGQGLQFASAYTFDENLRMSAGVQHFIFEGPFDLCITDFGGFGCDTLDATIGYVETTFSF